MSREGDQLFSAWLKSSVPGGFLMPPPPVPPGSPKICQRLFLGCRALPLRILTDPLSMLQYLHTLKLCAVHELAAKGRNLHFEESDMSKRETKG